MRASRNSFELIVVALGFESGRGIFEHTVVPSGVGRGCCGPIRLGGAKRAALRSRPTRSCTCPACMEQRVEAHTWRKPKTIENTSRTPNATQTDMLAPDTTATTARWAGSLQGFKPKDTQQSIQSRHLQRVCRRTKPTKDGLAVLHAPNCHHLVHICVRWVE